MRLSDEQRQLIEARIRAAMDRLLSGDLPAGGKCDIKTLAAEAGISRNSLYTTYEHLKIEFEERKERLQTEGQITDPREAQIDRLKLAVERLKERLEEKDAELSQLRAFKTQAISAIAAQYDELERLRRQLSRPTKVTSLQTVQHERPHRTLLTSQPMRPFFELVAAL
ncbi:hypothetical protein AB0F17_62290 [Nonomuraea sp. NPDC026600]|uniref:hypothetical protein n=1 Tax=Nonomuraea sp. NPDC026600 TaxID=3155363 RepID=UPI00340578B5